MIEILRAHRDELARRHVVHLWVFGSLARGDERPDSDVDIIVEFDSSHRLSLTGFSHLRLDLSDWLGRSVDLAQWGTLRPRVTESATNDAVLVF